MSRRKFIFKGGGKELVLPVTPDSYQVEKGINVEVVNIHQLGDAILAGYGTLATIKVSCIFPASRYPVSDGSDPNRYVGQLEKWVKKRQKLRFVVGGTGVNIPAIIQSVSYGERDGTNDVYADIILREYRQLKAVKVADTGANSGRPEPESTGRQLPPYTVKAGDCLCAIARKFLGDGSYQMAQKLAAYNFGSRDPNVLYVGEVVNFPPTL